MPIASEGELASPSPNPQTRPAVARVATARQQLRQINNPPNPWVSTVVEHLGLPPEAALEVFFDSSRQALSKNDSPDIPFTWSVNPYRGCFHGCAYCYARPTHEYLDFGAGTDFERKLVVKPEVAGLLRDAFDHPRWKGEVVVFSGNTDCYQPLEASWQLTRQCLQVCADYRNPVGIITKSTLIERDVELLAEIARTSHLTVTISLPFADPEVARAIEPYVPTPARRLRTIERLASAGIAVGINVAPLIPGLNDGDIPMLLRDAKAAGARFANRTMLRLPGPVKQVFEDRLRLMLPLRADKVMNQIREARDGKLTNSRFGDRMRGAGARWRMIEDLFTSAWHRFGFEPQPAPPPTAFRRPERPGNQLQLGL